MSVTEFPAAPPPEFERTPPQDVAAEQCVLGGMLLSKDAIADVVEMIRGHDFYRPAHELIYEAILDLYGRGEPADAVTISAELTKRGEIGRVGGAPYLHTLISSVPTAANAGYYARIVRERAILRRLVDAGTKIVQLGYATDGGDVDDIVDAAQAEVYQVTERRTSEDYAPLAAIMEGTLDEIEAIQAHDGRMVGVPTGFADLDQLTNGLHPGQMIVVAARPAVGKALALDTALPTPTGWTTMGEVQPGDYLLGADGMPARVVAATDVLHDRPCYEIEFNDGTVIVADAQHQWLTDTRASRTSAQAAAGGYDRYRDQCTAASVKTTEEIATTLRCDTADRRLNHTVSLARPAELPEADLPFPPYALGTWLGDGSSKGSRFTTADPEIVANLEAEGLVVTKVAGRYGYSMRLPEPPSAAERSCAGGGEPCRNDHRSVGFILRGLGVLGNKHIPAAYLRASVTQRRALLAGLLDTNGCVNPHGTVQFAVTNARLAADAWQLVLSLGYRAAMTTKRVKGHTAAISTCYVVTFTPTDKVFRLTRKLARQDGNADPETHCRQITDVRPVPSVPVRCVEVDNHDHLYLVGRTWIPTHNSTLGLDVARCAAIRNQLATVIFSLEMGRNEITMRLLSAEARVPLHHMRSGSMSDDDWTKLARKMGEVSNAPLFIDDSPNMSMMEIRAKARRLKQRHDLKLVIIDYLQLMSSGKRVESRQQEVSEFSRALKLLAKELEVPVIAISQLNRGPEQRTDKKPQMSDLRESGCLTADTRVLRADTGAETSLGELLADGARDIPVWALDESLRYVRRTMTHVFPSGRNEVFRLRLASGKEIRATANHPFLTYDGWRPLGELGPGLRIAVPRHVPAPVDQAGWDDAEVVRLAHLIGDGFVPAEVFQLPKRQIALFLRHLWGTEGSIWINPAGRGGRVYYASSTRRLAEDVARLLLRFGISARLRTVRKEGYRCGYQLDVSGGDDQRRFLNEIGVHGERGRTADRLLEIVRQPSTNTNVDTVPAQVWGRVRHVLADQGMSHRAVAAGTGTRFGDSTPLKQAPSRERLGRIAALLDDAELEMMAVNDVFWDAVVAVDSEGEEDVYDATVLGNHNFIANGIAVHNSIEQDADMVILLHREELYERESPRAGEADFIVAKHRNGPTATITVAFQGHYSRFVDMATN